MIRAGAATMIEVKNLCKKYGSFEAVKDLTFSVGGAEVLGFLGPNGAGKTTIMKMLTGCHYPSGGRVEINGVSVEEAPEETKKCIGYLPESNPLYGDLCPVEYLNFAASSRLIPKAERRKAVDAAISACGLEGHRNLRIENLSKGYRQRVGLAQAIIHDPDILILDEPSSGLDPNQIIEIRSLIRELGKRKTVILSTHILQEVEAVCSRVLILNEGRIAAQGTPVEIAETVKGRDAWELRLKGAKADELQAGLSSLSSHGKSVGELSAETLEDGTVLLCFSLAGGGSNRGGSNCSDLPDDGEMIFDWALSRGYKILAMARKRLSLEDIFVKLTNEQSFGDNQDAG